MIIDMPLTRRELLGARAGVLLAPFSGTSSPRSNLKPEQPGCGWRAFSPWSPGGRRSGHIWNCLPKDRKKTCTKRNSLGSVPIVDGKGTICGISVH
jgi:hypothetical protein